MNIALLGGSFNPPHLIHQMACLYLLEAEEFDQVWMLPCFRHAFAKELAPFAQRVSMCRLCAQAFGGRVVVAEVERDLPTQDGNRTVHTLRHLGKQHPDHRFTLVVGSDLVSELPSWKDFASIRANTPILVLRRAGHDKIDSEWSCSELVFGQISSTEIRRRLANKEPIHGLVPGTVARFIGEQTLYEV